jgi:predicted RNase H-like nuclease
VITPKFPHPTFEAGHWLQGVDGCKGGWVRLRARLPEQRHGPMGQVDATIHAEACTLVDQAHPLPLTAIGHGPAITRPEPCWGRGEAACFPPP